MRSGTGKAAGSAWWLLAAGWLLASGCTSVRQMQARYEAGDASQYRRILTIAARPDYPYATRRAAAAALGEIGDPQAVPVLVHILGEFDKRITLKKEALTALGQIGDPGAVTAIGRLLDRSLGDNSQELRQAAMPVLGQLGGPEAAQILVNALTYYDLVMLRREGRVQRGVFTGDEDSIRDLQDSLRVAGQRSGDSRLGGGLGGGFGSGGLFGPNVSLPQQQIVDTTSEERRVAHQSLVQVGAAAVPVIQQHLADKPTTISLGTELREILEQIRGADQIGSDGQVRRDDQIVGDPPANPVSPEPGG